MKKDGKLFKYEDLLGKEFEYGARGPDKYDCYGLCIELRQRAGLPFPENYATITDRICIDREMWAAAGELFEKLRSPSPGCIVSFMVRPPFTSHIGIVLPNLYQFIHITKGTRVAVERFDIQPWSRRCTGFWEVRRDG